MSGRTLHRSAVVLAFLSLSASTLAGQRAPASPTAGDTALASALGGLSFREIGPAITGGRVADVEGLESNPAVFFVGLATGGVWKTENHGMTWKPLFDDQPCSSIGDVAVYQANPNVIYVGTGEPQNRQSSPYGCGVFRSTDGGRTWQDLGLTETRHVGRIRIDPRNPDVAFVAAVGHLWGPNEERGVYRTRDGGKTWDRVLYIDENTGAIDLAMDPADPNTLFAAMYQRRRTAYGFSASGPGSGLYRTTDGGETWTELTKGLPEGDKGRIGVDVYRRNGNLVYALVESRGQGRGLYRSEDRGETWTRVSGRNPRPMYFSQVRIDPNNPERIYLGGVQMSASDDGGRTWWKGNAAQGAHVDHHAIWIDPGNSRHVLIGNDGGVASSWDGARHWRVHTNLAIGQFYEIGVDMRDPYRVCGGLQDNSSWCGPSRTLAGRGAMNRDWQDVWGGDGFYNRIDPTNPDIVYTESQGGNSGRVNLASDEAQTLRPVNRAAGEEAGAGYRFNWDAPLVVSRHDPATIYVGANHLLRSRDRGVTWEEASPDLTRRIDRDTLTIMGARVTERTLSRNDGIRSYGTITTIGESPLNADVLYVGTDDGNLQVTRDGGATWTNVVDHVPGLPGRSYVSGIEPSHAVEGRVYAAFDRHYDDDYAPYVYVSDDYGATWRSITAGLPAWSVNVVREHPKTPELLFAGNEIGVYVSVDGGSSWARMRHLPTVPVDDIVLHPRDNDLVLGTHGRSIWILDDVAPLQDIAARGALKRPSYLFPVRRATEWFTLGNWPFWGDAFAARNPADGALIRYWLREDLPDSADAPPDVKISIREPSGRVVRALEGPGTAGLHEVVWDMREAPPVKVEAGGGRGAGGGRFGAPRGALVLPGTYLVHMEAGMDVAEQEVRVRLDPRSAATPADLRARRDAARGVATLAGSLVRAQRALGRLADQVRDARELLKKAEAPDGLKAEADTLKTELDTLRARLGRAGRIGRLGRALERTGSAPTSDQKWQIEQAWQTVPPLIETLNTLISERMPAFYRRLNAEGVRPDPGKPLKVPRRPGG